MKRYSVIVAIVLSSSAPVLAVAGTESPDFMDASAVPYGETGRATITRPELLAAGYLEHAASVGEAAARLLAAEQAGELDTASAHAAHAVIRDFLQRDDYERARFLADALWQHWSLDRYNGFWLDQAAGMLDRGDGAGAEKSLRHLRKPWSADISRRRYSLWGRLYLLQAQYENAVVSLEKQVAIAGDGLFDHYNLGLAMLYAGQRERGFALLDEIGYLALDSDEHRALRDRANLALGWHWLASDQGGTAREYFKRVSLDGPYSSLGLLGLGWAELAADGEPQVARFKRRVLCEKAEVPPDALMRVLSDRYAPCRPGEVPGVIEISHQFAFDPATRGVERYVEALRPWQVLAQREAHDPAVQEALLATAYAQQRRDALAEAERSYRLAITRFEGETARLMALAQALRQPAADPRLVVAEHARPDEFAALRASHDYIQHNASLDALRQLEAELSALDARLARHDEARLLDPSRLAALRQRLAPQRAGVAELRQHLQHRLREDLLAELAIRRQRLDLYHSNARLALARMYDRPAAP